MASILGLIMIIGIAIVGGGFRSLACLWNIYDADRLRAPDLLSGKADALAVVHRFQHFLRQLADGGVHSLDGAAFFRRAELP